MDTFTAIDRIARRLAAARRVLFITGAGISADSGLPTYRGVGGLYNDEATEDGLPIEVALSGDVFAVRPDITWKYLAQIERNCRGAMPNSADKAMENWVRVTSLDPENICLPIPAWHWRTKNSATNPRR